MDHDENHKSNGDVIDIIDLLGVVIKHRRFMAIFVVLFTLLGTGAAIVYKFDSIFVPEEKYDPRYTVVVAKDPVFASYVFLKRPQGTQDSKNALSRSLLSTANDIEMYKKSIGALLFPSLLDVPEFGVRNIKGFTVNYFFLKAKDSEIFTARYNAFVDTLNKFREYGAKMNESLYSSCRQFYNSRPGQTKEISAFFDNLNDVKICNAYNYYMSVINNRLSYAVEVAPTDVYTFFISDFVNDLEKCKAAPISAVASGDVKIKLKEAQNVKRIIKYAALMFILSGVFSVLFAFVIEFWSNNRKKLSIYWKN